MGTIAQKLQYTADAVDAIQQAIIDKGVEVPDGAALAEYAGKIREIGGTLRPEGYWGVSFHDFDGSLIKTEWVAPGGSVREFPAQPVHPEYPFLVPAGYNYIPEDLANVRHDYTVGAMYDTSDGKTHVIGKTTGASGTAFTLCFNRSGAGTLSVDLGNGSEVITTTATGVVQLPVDMGTPGEFHITVWMSAGSGTVGLGGNTEATTFIIESAKRGIVTGVFLGPKCILYDHAFRSFVCLEYVTFGSTFGAATVYNYALWDCRSLRFLALSRNITKLGVMSFPYRCAGYSFPVNTSDIGVETLKYSTGISHVVLPEAAVVLGTGLLNYSFTIDEITVGPKVTTINGTALSDIPGLKKLYMTALTPPTIAANFLTTTLNPQLRILVPAGCGEAYKNAPNWSALAAYITEMPGATGQP